ncbi:MarR family transcriptional regulator [Tamaricihabitans halophyticus]|uniref:MarR family transcriptional regulator n=1 Tax=Tamaricihabitans halophyticus TaxID=1262583 RepID=A0A4R2R134_9PSEU|nr:MarR family winged helix-turn-helix transcriptional regulator [Tamaricihabitans halophyticus]TCP55188.1 MarR family transcriptional regulator [Tamaricihabitans halophyticus]
MAGERTVDATGAEPGGGPELFRLVRFWARRWASQVAVDAAGAAEVAHVHVVEAVHSAAYGRDVEVAVPEVAHQLGVDRSVASRMVSAAAAAGYVHRQASASDARRIGVRLTETGRELLAAAYRWQQETFDNLVAGWEPADASRFAGYLRRLADELLESPS